MTMPALQTSVFCPMPMSAAISGDEYRTVPNASRTCPGERRDGRALLQMQLAWHECGRLHWCNHCSRCPSHPRSRCLLPTGFWKRLSQKAVLPSPACPFPVAPCLTFSSAGCICWSKKYFHVPLAYPPLPPALPWPDLFIGLDVCAGAKVNDLEDTLGAIAVKHDVLRLDVHVRHACTTGSGQPPLQTLSKERHQDKNKAGIAKGCIPNRLGW